MPELRFDPVLGTTVLTRISALATPVSTRAKALPTVGKRASALALFVTITAFAVGIDHAFVLTGTGGTRAAIDASLTPLKLS